MIDIKHKTTGQVLLRHEGELFRFADLSGAILIGADLRGADLSWADLRGADLSWADLSFADLSGADLSGAILIGADLSWADLRGADLRFANLHEANLYNADLHGANLYKVDLQVIQLGRYTAYVTSSNTRIGCKVFSNAEWRGFDDAQIASLALDALAWWTVNKAAVFAAMDALSAQFPETQEQEVAS